MERPSRPPSAPRPVILIAAVGRNGAIGFRDGLPWRIPSDLKRFRSETMGKPVLMGRRTFASLGRALPGRHLVVVSRDPALALPDAVALADSVPGALARGQDLAVQHGAAEVMVAGGSALYRATMEIADALRLTEVDLEPEADSVFPPIDPALWRIASRVAGSRAPGDEADVSYVEYRRL